MNQTEADARLSTIMTTAARRILEPGSDAYEIGVEACGLVLDEVIDTAEHGGVAYAVWAELTDVASSPWTGAHAWCVALTELASRDWLSIDMADVAAVARYFERWQDPMLLTARLFEDDVSGDWRTEYFSYLERELGDVLHDLAGRIRPFDHETSADYVEHAEYGLALEHLTYAASEFEVPISEQERRRLTHLARLVGSDMAMRDLSRVPESRGTVS
ncbi:MafI family immunity protein [Promicromonospora sukumoe]